MIIMSFTDVYDTLTILLEAISCFGHYLLGRSVIILLCSRIDLSEIHV